MILVDSWKAFAMQRNYASHIQIIKVHEGGEPVEFKVLFNVWEKEQISGQMKPSMSRISELSSFYTQMNLSAKHISKQIDVVFV